MIATQDQMTRQMRNRFKTTAMGLGLVRLLQDAKRFEEAKTTLHSLENGFQGVAAESAKPSLEPMASSTITMPFRATSIGTKKQRRSSLQVAGKLDRSHLGNVEWHSIQ